jgi:hypothetical protein
MYHNVICSSRAGNLELPAVQKPKRLEGGPSEPVLGLFLLRNADKVDSKTALTFLLSAKT